VWKANALTIIHTAEDFAAGVILARIDRDFDLSCITEGQDSCRKSPHLSTMPHRSGCTVTNGDVIRLLPAFGFHVSSRALRNPCAMLPPSAVSRLL
jgi:hypothetical protein